MRLTQERILELIQTAERYQDDRTRLRVLTMQELERGIYISRVKSNPELIKILELTKLHILNCTELDIDAVITLANEKAHFTPARMKHNLYMRSVKRKHNAKQKLKSDPLDLGKDKDSSSESEVFLNVEARQAVLIKNGQLDLKKETAELENQFPSEYQTNLKEKFGEDYHPLPPKIGLRRK
jgi:hypothetical protein